MGEQYAGGLVGFDPQFAILCLFAASHLAEPARLRKCAAAEAVGALAAGEILQQLGSNAGDGEECLLHVISRLLPLLSFERRRRRYNGPF